MPKNGDYTYVYSAGQISQVLDKIKSTGRPDKLTTTYVKDTWVLKNAQFSAVVELLKDMKFLNSDGTPTELYAEFQNPNLEKVALAKGTKNAYNKLFKAYPNAQNLSKSELEGYLKQQTGADGSVVSKIYGTVKKLMSLSDFTHSAMLTHEKKQSTSSNHPDSEKSNSNDKNINQIPITMNIQIVIPSDASAETYDKIFASIKKHLRN